VVERSEQQHGVDGLVGKVQCASVTDRCVDAIAVAIANLVDMMANEIAMHDVVASVDEPIGVRTRSTSDICDHRPARRKRPLHDLDSAPELDASDSTGESIALTLVVRLKGASVHESSLPIWATTSTDFRSRTW
jgi:hypothetical protein